MGDLLHDAYGDAENPRIPAPRREDDEGDAGSVVERLRSWSVDRRETAAAWTGVVLARTLTRPRTGSGAPAG